MTFDYAASKADALELLTEFGQTGAIVRETVTGGGPTDPTGGAATNTEYPAKLVVLPMDAQQVGKDVAGTNIRESDVMIYVQADIGVTPQPDDRVTCDNGTFVVLRCNPLSPAGVTVLFDIVGRAQ